MAGNAVSQAYRTNRCMRKLEETSNGTREVVQNIKDVSAAASETGQASHKVRATTEEMAVHSSKLKEDMEKFITEIRVA